MDIARDSALNPATFPPIGFPAPLAMPGLLVELITPLLLLVGSAAAVRRAQCS